MSNGKVAKEQDVITNLDEQFDGNSQTALEKLQRVADTAVQPKEFLDQTYTNFISVREFPTTSMT